MSDFLLPGMIPKRWMQQSKRRFRVPHNRPIAQNWSAAASDDSRSMSEPELLNAVCPYRIQLGPGVDSKELGKIDRDAADEICFVESVFRLSARKIEATRNAFRTNGC